MSDDLGYVDSDISEKAQAIALLLARVDPDDEKRRHTRAYDGQPWKAVKYIRRCQRMFLSLRAVERDELVVKSGCVDRRETASAPLSSERLEAARHA